jgi:hypothetical protein
LLVSNTIGLPNTVEADAALNSGFSILRNFEATKSRILLVKNITRQILSNHSYNHWLYNEKTKTGIVFKDKPRASKLYWLSKDVKRVLRYRELLKLNLDNTLFIQAFRPYSYDLRAGMNESQFKELFPDLDKVDYILYNATDNYGLNILEPHFDEQGFKPLCLLALPTSERWKPSSVLFGKGFNK